MVPRVIFSSSRLFVTFITRWEWRLRGDADSWWFDVEFDFDRVEFPAHDARYPWVYFRLCGVEIMVWL